MQEFVRTALSRYLTTQHVPSPEEVGIPADHPLMRRKDIVFVTIYRNGEVIASSGRVAVKKSSSAVELVENALLCLKDPRIAEFLGDPTLLDAVRIRVDIIPTEKRKIISTLSEIDPNVHGLILISEQHEALGVVLPGMSRLASTPEELFFLVAKKAGLDSQSLSEEEYILYTIETEVSADPE
ncbi:MAG TPA: AMMECR1 domain-containing protein [bacterium]|nr:AMMECR1 domain-containing protein [bacterium]